MTDKVITISEAITAFRQAWDGEVEDEEFYVGEITAFLNSISSSALTNTSGDDATTEAVTPNEPVGWLVKHKRSSSAGTFFHAEPLFNENWDREDYVVTPLFTSPQPQEAMALLAYYERQIEWSRDTFGPALRTNGIIDHIKKELKEIEGKPHDLSEWVDVVILAMDGFWRHGGNAADLMPALIAKQRKNIARVWPDWRTMSEDTAIEHDRSHDARPQSAAVRDGWQPIETAPMDGSRILISHKYGLKIAWWGAAAYNRKTKSYNSGWTDGGNYGFAATHWMPLPAAPALHSTQEG